MEKMACPDGITAACRNHTTDARTKGDSVMRKMRWVVIFFCFLAIA